MKKKKIAVVFLVAGLGSRFGEKIKQFANIGYQGETLIEISVEQAVKAGFEKIIFVVGEKTEKPFKKNFGNEYKGIPVYYSKQIFDKTKRDKPMGTADALLSAKNIIEEDFVICNGDDIYGENALRTAKKFLMENNNEGVAIGYELGKVIPEKGKTNRGIFEKDKEGNVKNIIEIYGLEKNNLEEKNLDETMLASMNLFGLRKEILGDLEKKLLKFKENNKKDRKKECILPKELSDLIAEGKLKIKLIHTNDRWFGVTNPDDENIIRAIFKKM